MKGGNMLLTKYVTLKWNSKIYKHYVDLGYTYTKMNDEFEVYIDDLTPYSRAKIKCNCDYCHDDYETTWWSYNKGKKNGIKKDCCSKPECTTQKAQEALVSKYGTSNIREIPEVNEKIKMTNIEKYGCENPFGNKDVQNKIKYYYMQNYGVTHNMQLNECVQKAKNTSIERYGVDNYSKTKEYRVRFRGENSPVWKGDLAIRHRDGRELPEYRDWRKSVFDRDHYTCQCCGNRNGDGKTVYLEAHHIFNWRDNVDLRYDVDNGITLCKDCHLRFHKKYGKRNNTKEQFVEFVNNYKIDKKIC